MKMMTIKVLVEDYSKITIKALLLIWTTQYKIDLKVNKKRKRLKKQSHGKNKVTKRIIMRVLEYSGALKIITMSKLLIHGKETSRQTKINRFNWQVRQILHKDLEEDHSKVLLFHLKETIIVRMTMKMTRIKLINLICKN